MAKLLQKLKNYLTRNWTWYLFVSATILTTIFSAILGLSDWHNVYKTGIGRLFIGSCAFLLISFVIHNKKEMDFETQGKRLNEAEKSLDVYKKIDPHQIITHILMGISKEKLHLTASDRISLYQVTPEGFILRGRFSENESFKEKGRSIYPLDQGCIGVAREQGEFKRLDLPDPSAYRTTYYSILERDYKIPTTTAHSFSMKSRCIIGLRIKSLDQSETVGVVVVESINKNGFDPDKIFAHLKNELSTFASILIGFKEELAIKRPSGLEGAF